MLGSRHYSNGERVTLTNCYATLDAFKQTLSLDPSDASDNARLEAALNAACRLIDDHCGRRFWQDAAVVDRTFYADTPYAIDVPDVSTLTGLVVKIDDNDDGTFETTLTIGTHYVCLPLNAEDETPARPYDAIRLVDSAYRFPRYASGRPGVQVTARYGWAAVPPSVALAACVQAAQLLKAGDAPFGILQMSTFDGAAVRIGSSLHPAAEQLLAGFQRPRVG